MREPKKFNPHPFPYHQEIEVEITALSNLGVGIARVQIDPEGSSFSSSLPGLTRKKEESEGWVVFVPHTLPGETVLARVFRNDKSHSQADLVEVIAPSPDRLDPMCPLFGRCGGCQYQHLSYEKQLAWKTRQVEELLQHMAGVKPTVSAAIPSPKQWGYRSKITPHFKRPRDGKIGDIGFLLAGQRSHLVDVPQCPIAMDEINDALPRIRQETRANAKAYKKDATLLLRRSCGTEPQQPSYVETNHRNPITESVETDNGPVTFHFLAGDFFQNNPFILPAFTGFVADHASSGGAKYLVDAYCGSGLFSLCLAHRFEKVSGVEVSETAADWARRNAQLNHIDNTSFRAASAEAIFEDITYPAAETSVVIDPPRKGCNQEFLDQLFAFGPSKVVYVSCNPATQMRDLKEFLAAGYQLTTVQPFDLFPQTRHLECVIVLEKGDPA
ncbi:MAG: class I SAM-dependent RNA methyltransferase [Verrucomicrobiae bacterium]|nr:class I SAM-dependent RNA methyltransferase [Verrucomicrobiae bacterium]NNJ42900.1 class I SAM-dependent RNA methyltransferase [Akkermansiaceae bacterium]